MNNENTIVVGKENTLAFSYLALRRGLMLEMKGIKMFRGSTAYATIKSRFGFKGNKQKVLDQFTAYLKDQSILVD